MGINLAFSFGLSLWWTRVSTGGSDGNESDLQKVQSLGQEDPLEKGMASHSSILIWEIPWTEELGGLQSMGSQRVGHDWATNTFTTIKMINTFTPPQVSICTFEFFLQSSSVLFHSMNFFIQFFVCIYTLIFFLYKHQGMELLGYMICASLRYCRKY